MDMAGPTLVVSAELYGILSAPDFTSALCPTHRFWIEDGRTAEAALEKYGAFGVWNTLDSRYTTPVAFETVISTLSRLGSERL